MVRRRNARMKVQQARRSPVPSAGPPLNPEDIPPGLFLAEVEAVLGDLFDSVAEGTDGVYKKHLRYFASWCDGRTIARTQVVTEHVQVYLREARENRRVSVSWQGCAAAAIKKALAWDGRADAVDWDSVAAQLRIYRKWDRQQPAQVDGITREYFELLEAAAWHPMEGEWPEKTARRATLDLALIAVMRDSLLRRSEAAAMRWGDITVERRPGHVYGCLKVPFSKTDQFAVGEVGYLQLSTLVRLQEMAVACGRDPSDSDQLVFGLGEAQVARRIKAACHWAGLPGRFSGHSCRVGMALDLGANDTELVGIMQSGRWRNPRSVVGYLRRTTVEKGAVARLYKRCDGPRI